MSTTETTPEICTQCEVPTHLHGTACGWRNATWLMYPANRQENEWSRKWMDAHPGAYPSPRPLTTAS